MLCDAAVVRDGLISILNGGVTAIRPTGYPSPALVVLAGLIELDYLDQDNEHELRVAVCDETGAELGAMTATFKAVSELRLDAFAYLPLAVPLSGVTLPEAGDYEVRALIDGREAIRLPLRAAHCE
jgi:hypothetical protein